MSSNRNPGPVGGLSDVTPFAAAWVDRHGRHGKLGEPEFREPQDDISVYIDRPAQRDDLDSGVVVISEADLTS